jgi:hypothetical protein
LNTAYDYPESRPVASAAPEGHAAKGGEKAAPAKKDEGKQGEAKKEPTKKEESKK